MPIRLRRSEFRVIALVIVVAAVSLALAVKYFSRAFPEASITFRVNRSQSLPIAQQFLQGQGLDPRGYDHASIFGYDDDTKLYLQRTQGLEGMNRLASGPVHLWRWQHRWFRPEQKEEFRADVTPAGEVVGFDHELAEAAPGASLDQEAAHKLAENFLSTMMHSDLNGLEFVEAVSTKRPARTDHAFTWKQKSVNLGDGSVRVEVTVSGDRVTGYNEYVKIPDEWRRSYDRLRSRNDAAQLVDEVFWFLLSAAMLAMLIIQLRDGDVPLPLATKFGVVAAILFLLSEFNTFSIAKFGYPTTDPYASFLGSYFTRGLLAAVGVGVLIFLVVAAAEPMYREGLPNRLSLRRVFTWQGLRTRSFFIANVVGLGLTFFFFAYQAVFYIAANRLGAWAPADIPFTNDLNTSIPWVAVLFGGFLPAVSEELQFRAFAVPFLRKYVRNWPLAIVLAAFNWSFLHSAYPNEPFFIRGLEVGLGGIVIGFVMWRFGIVATLIWHYSVDALYTAFLLLRSPNHYLMVSGALTAGVMLIPLVVALAAYWRTGTFADEGGLTNASEGIVRPPREETASAVRELVHYQPLSRRRLTVAGALIVASALAAMIHSDSFGAHLKVHVTRAQAISQADSYLADRGVPVKNYQRTAWLQNNVDPLAVKYMLQFRSLRDTDRLYRQATKLALWHVRYFRPLQKEEYSVFVDPESGAVFAAEHTLDEDAPGASLTPDQALEIGRRFVTSQGFNLAAFDLQNSEAEKRKAREDYTLTWEARPGSALNVGDARYRLTLNLAGDQVVGFSRYFKLPEAWERQESEQKVVNVVLWVVTLLVGAGIFAGALWLFLRQVRGNELRWRQALPVGIVLGIIFLLSALNAMGLVNAQYPTSLPFSTFRLFIAISYLVVTLVVALAGWVLVAFALSLYPDAWRVFSAKPRTVWARDGAVILVLVLAAGAGLHKLEALVFSHFHAYAAVGGDAVNPDLATAFPGGGLFLRALSYALFSVASLAVLIRLAITVARRRPWWIWLGLAALLVSLGPASAHSLGEFLVGWSTTVVELLAGLGIVAFFLRDNVAAYLAVAFAVPLASPLVDLLGNATPYYRWNGVVLAVLAVTVLIWILQPAGRPEHAQLAAAGPPA